MQIRYFHSVATFAGRQQKFAIRIFREGKGNFGILKFYLLDAYTQFPLPISRHWLRSYHGFESPRTVGTLVTHSAMDEDFFFLFSPQPIRRRYDVDPPPVASIRCSRMVPEQRFEPASKMLRSILSAGYDRPQAVSWFLFFLLISLGLRASFSQN